MFLGGVGGGDFFPPPMSETLHFVQGDG